MNPLVFETVTVALHLAQVHAARADGVVASPCNGYSCKVRRPSIRWDRFWDRFAAKARHFGEKTPAGSSGTSGIHNNLPEYAEPAI